MELCSPNMSESGGGSLCQVKQLPCHSVPLCHLQASGHHVHNLPHLTHQPWVNHAAPTVASGPAVALCHRVNGATMASSSSQECAASRLGEEAALARGISTGKVLVTGGGGYFGSKLGRELTSQGMSVILMDINKPPSDIPDGAVFYQSDIRDYSSLYKVCEGVDCIFHTASYGMSGPEQLRKEQVESINVGGTNNVINVCKERNIPRLVYTSTINVVFTGKPIEECDEASMPHVPPDVHIDHYSRTKAIAEQMVLSANGCSLKGVKPSICPFSVTVHPTGGGLLRTCVLRPCGIYGPDERRHLHRVMCLKPPCHTGFLPEEFTLLIEALQASSYNHLLFQSVLYEAAVQSAEGLDVMNVERRLFVFRFGDPQARMNWVHVENLVLAHTLAAEALTSQRSYVSSGQVYFINDGVSVNLFEWLTPLFENLGYSRPLITLPVSLVYLAAKLVEYLHVILSPVIKVPLLFTQSEVRSIAVSHTFKIDKARRELGYSPKPYSLVDCVEEYLKTRPPRSSCPPVSLFWASQLPRNLVLLLLMGLSLVLLMLSCILCQD